MAARESGGRKETRRTGGASSDETERRIKPKSLKGARRKGEEAVASGKSWLSFPGAAGIICSLSSLLIPTAGMLFPSKSFYTAPQGLTLGWADICCSFLLHSVLFGDVLLISSFVDLASLSPPPSAPSAVLFVATASVH